jgi:hypothetical protein
LVLAAVVGLGLGLSVLKVGSGAKVFTMILLAFLIGLEASSLRRWTLQRRGRPLVDVVTASDSEEAETKSFGRWLSRGGAATPKASFAPAAAYHVAEPVIGLFPEAERRA